MLAVATGSTVFEELGFFAVVAVVTGIALFFVAVFECIGFAAFLAFATFCYSNTNKLYRWLRQICNPEISQQFVQTGHTSPT